jgi:hypothetical protein
MATKMVGKIVQRDFWGVRVKILEEVSPDGRIRNYAATGGVERFLIAPASVLNQGKGERIKFHAVRSGDHTCKIRPGIEKRYERWIYRGESQDEPHPRAQK